MGQKINPIGFRMGGKEDWRSRWFADPGRYRKFLLSDIRLREVLMEKFKLAGVTKVEIERSIKSMKVTIYVTRPGVVIGRGGSGLEETKRLIEEKLLEIDPKVGLPKIELLVEEVKQPELSAQLVAARIVSDLERRLPHRRVVMRTMERVMEAGAKGIKIRLSGRIGGADIGRTETYHQGAVPLQTLRAKIDYAEMPALLKKGYVGVKVWIHRSEEE